MRRRGRPRREQIAQRAHIVFARTIAAGWRGRSARRFYSRSRAILYPDSLGRRKALAKRVELDSFEGMIRPGFLLGDERSALIALARDGSVTHRLARRANALVLLDNGLSCEQVARVLLLDD